MEVTGTREFSDLDGTRSFSETESIRVNESVNRIDVVLSSSGGGGVSSSLACCVCARQQKSDRRVLVSRPLKAKLEEDDPHENISISST
ncbi:hypothetical protein AOLI_G00140630 [Acnodon oligacanthus]